MFNKNRKFDKVVFTRHPLKISAEKRARFSFPIIVFLASLIISPLIFITIVASERMITKLVTRAKSIISRSSEDGQSVSSAPSCLFRHPLDGTCTEEKWENKKIVAVSIDNHVESRPPSGLSSARLVISAPVEAGITRFLAFYAEGDEVREIGPVRSARPYFLDWAEEYKATLVHVGGSEEALTRIKDEKIETIDEFRKGSYFWRDGRRVAPHSTYSSSKNLFAASRRISDIKPWPIAVAEEAAKSGKNSSLRISAASSAYEAQWNYDANKNEYTRYQAGSRHLDKEEVALAAKNVIVLRMPQEIIDEVGRRKIETLGSGAAIILRGGEMIAGVWRRNTLGERTVFEDNNGKEIMLFPGVTWIEIVSKTAKVEYNE